MHNLLFLAAAILVTLTAQFGLDAFADSSQLGHWVQHALLVRGRRQGGGRTGPGASDRRPPASAEVSWTGSFRPVMDGRWPEPWDEGDADRRLIRHRKFRPQAPITPAEPIITKMPAYRISEVAELMGVSADTARRLVDSGRVKTARATGGNRLIDGADLARFLSEQGSLTPPAAVGRESARNHFSGIVTRVLKDGVMAQVDIQAGPHRIVSLMSREAAEDLGLEPGVRAVATVKSTTVIVELPQ